MIDIEYVDEFIDRLSAVFNEREHGKQFPELISVEYGRKFARIVHDNGTQRFVHCFIDMSTGDVIKSAGWQAPQRGKNGLAIRYNLLDDESRALCYTKMDPYGSYLYAR